MFPPPKCFPVAVTDGELSKPRGWESSVWGSMFFFFKCFPVAVTAGGLMGAPDRPDGETFHWNPISLRRMFPRRPVSEEGKHFPMAVTGKHFTSNGSGPIFRRIAPKTQQCFPVALVGNVSTAARRRDEETFPSGSDGETFSVSAAWKHFQMLSRRPGRDVETFPPLRERVS